MASNVQKTPIARTLNQFAQQKALAAIQLQGRGLPGSVTAVSGSIVTVKFSISSTPDSPFTLPNVTMPLAGSQWWRQPTQVGDMGVALPADTYLGGVSGLGGGTADLSLQSNLSALIFLPIGNKNWSAPDDPNAHVLYGPDGVILRDSNKKTVFTLNANGVTLTVQSGDFMSVSSGGAVQQLLTALAMAVYNGHTHSTPDGESGPPTPQMSSADLTATLRAQ